MNGFTRRGWWLTAVILFLFATTSLRANAQGSWEMRVCADPDNFPASDAERSGFENRIAAVIADELGADLTYFWSASAFDHVVDEYLLTGECDLMMGVGEGVMDLLNTVAYYRAPHVFVFRRDAVFTIESLDDPALRNLRIGTYAGGVAHGAMLRRGLSDNLLTRNAFDPDPDRSILEAVLNGQIDVGILYGPPAGYFALHETSDLRVEPVSPEIDPPLSAMYSVWTMGVRPGDEAFRDQLNLALARRWDEIQGILDEFGVPRTPVPRPRAPDRIDPGIVRVGLVLPMPNSRRLNTDIVATAAASGGTLAEGSVDRETPDRRLEIFLASAPDSISAVRAARRLALTDGVVALVGGIGPGHVDALVRSASELDVLFFNIGSATDSIRSPSAPRQLFHVEASATTYLTRLIDRLAEDGHQRWFVVHEDSFGGRGLAERVDRAITTATPAARIETTAVIAGGHVYHAVLDEIRAADPEIILLLLAAEDQESFLAQYERAEIPAGVIGMADPIGQTRDFHTRLRQVAARASASYRAALWETTLPGDAAELNSRFVGRTGEPMDPSAWATWAAVKIAYETAVATEDSETSAMIAHLEDADTSFDLGKDVALSFDPDLHQLLQPLYLVRIRQDAEWGAPVSSRIGITELVDELREPRLDGRGP